MSNQKDKARHKILGELESIKSLLQGEDGKTLEPPLLTDPVDTDEAPLLTETWDEESARPAGRISANAGAEPLAETNIPVLNIAVEDDDRKPDEESADDEDIVARALQQRHYGSSADDPEPDSPRAEQTRSPSAESEQRQEAEVRSEQQPGLFDSQPTENDDGGGVAEQIDSALSGSGSGSGLDSSSGSHPDPTPGATTPASPRQSENPFLPKHIRDRINANRALQQEIAKTFTSAPYSPIPRRPRNPASGSLAVDEELIDQLVKRYLPRIEAELREKLRAMLKEERHQQDSDQS
jgi:hypothetical protein